MALTYRNIEQIQILAQFKSFAKASRHLHLSQPALSRSISNVEEQLGVRIFDRRHNNVTPTLFGKHILEKGIPILQELRLLQRDLHLLRDNQAGEIHIGCGPFPAEMFIGDALARFHSTYPKLDLHVTVDKTPQLLRSLRERSLDLFVADTRMILHEDDLEIVNLKQHQAFFCCSSNHHLSTIETVEVKDVLEYPLATMWLPTSVIATLHKIYGISSPELTDLPCSVIKCDNFSILLKIISSTNAIGISSEEIIDKFYHKERIKLLPITIPEFMTHYGIVSLKGCTQPPAIENLNRCIQKAADD